MVAPAPSPAPAPGPFRFRSVVPVRFRDLDALGHVNNAVYFTYMEIGRTEYWMHLTGEPRVTGLSFIVARATCDFKSAAQLGETLEVGVRVPAIRNSSFDFDYEIRERATARLVAIGLTVQVCYDYAAKTSVRVPPDVRARIEAFEATGALRPPSAAP